MGCSTALRNPQRANDCPNRKHDTDAHRNRLADTFSSAVHPIIGAAIKPVRKKGGEKADFWRMFRLLSKTRPLLVVDEGNIHNEPLPQPLPVHGEGSKRHVQKGAIFGQLVSGKCPQAGVAPPIREDMSGDMASHTADCRRGGWAAAANAGNFRRLIR